MWFNQVEARHHSSTGTDDMTSGCNKNEGEDFLFHF